MRPANLTSWRRTGDEGRLDRAGTFQAGFEGRPAGCGGRGGDTCARRDRRRLRRHDRPGRLSEPHADRASPPALDHASSGAKDVAPRSAIRVGVTGGTILRVTVRTAGDPVGGTLNASATGWRSRRHARRRHALQGPRHGNRPAGRTVTDQHVPHAQPHQTFAAQIFEGYSQTYGVGMPIILTFSRPITDRRAVERARSSCGPRSGWSAPGTGTGTPRSTSGRATTGRRTPECASSRA